MTHGKGSNFLKMSKDLLIRPLAFAVAVALAVVRVVVVALIV